MGSVVMKGCKSAAKMLSTATLTLGCRSYLDAQERSCYCAPQSSQSDKKSKDYKKQKYSKSDGGGYGNGQQNPPPYGWRPAGEL